MSSIKKIKELLKISIIKTIYFNFHYLPFKQAIKLPIFLYNPKLKLMNGTVKIEAEKIKPGMIRMGKWIVSLYPNYKQGIMWEHRGVCIFNGKVQIGSGSAISTGLKGKIIFGNNFEATSTFRIASYKQIIMGENCSFSWENIVVDTDFHETIDVTTNKRSNPVKPIIIGDNNWFGIRTMILKGTETPNFCIFGANSLLNKKYDVPEYSLLAGNPAKFIKEGLYRDLNSYVK
jgi:acetyltransferase-like isoleucine patch superfamily enzyme